MPSEPGANVSSAGPLRKGAEYLDLLSFFPSEADANDAAPGSCDGGMSAGITTTNSEPTALAARPLQPREMDPAFKQSAADVAAFKRELAQLSEVVRRLTAEYSRIEQATRAAEERSTAALEIVNVLEARLGPLAMPQDLGRRTDARLTALNAAVLPAYVCMTSLTRRLARVMTGLPRRPMPRSRRHHSVVVGAPGALVLASFIVARALWTQIRLEASR